MPLSLVGEARGFAEVRCMGVIEVEAPGASVVEVEVPGSVGPAGPAGPVGSTDVERVTAATLSGHRLVVPITGGAVAYASCDDIDQPGRPIWLTTGAWEAGSTITVHTYGLVQEPSWNWPLAPLFLGLNGFMTPVAPTTGVLRQVAVAMSPTEVFFDPQPPIILA